MSEQLDVVKRFTPGDMAKLLIERGLATGATTVAIKPESDDLPEGPYEGKIIQLDGRSYRYTAAMAHIYNRQTGRFNEMPLTLRTWFSHSTPDEGIDMGPGWDSRFHLSRLTSGEQMERYGHTFSLHEISDPRTMPDIPYFELEPIEDDPQDF